MNEREIRIGEAAFDAAVTFAGGWAPHSEGAARLARFALHAGITGGEPLYRWAEAEGIAGGEGRVAWRDVDHDVQRFFHAFVACVNALATLIPEEAPEAAPAPVVDRRPPRIEDTIFVRDQRAGDSAYPEAVRRGETSTAGISVRQEEPVLAPGRHQATAPAFSVYRMDAPGAVREDERGRTVFSPSDFLAQREAIAADLVEGGLDPATAALRAEAMTLPGNAHMILNAPPPRSKEPDYDDAERLEVDASSKLEPTDKGPAKGSFTVKRKKG